MTETIERNYLEIKSIDALKEGTLPKIIHSIDLVDPIDFWILHLTNTETLLDRHKETLEQAGFKFVRVFED